MFCAVYCGENTSGDYQASRTPFLKSIYSSMWKTVLSGLERSTVCDDGDAKGPKFFMGYFQVFSDKTATTSKNTSPPAYPVHIVLMTCSSKYRHCLIQNKHIMVRSLPVRVISDWANSCIIYEVQSSVHWFTSTDAFHSQNTMLFPTQWNARQTKSFYFMTLQWKFKIPWWMLGLQILRCTEWERMYGISSHRSCLTAAT